MPNKIHSLLLALICLAPVCLSAQSPEQSALAFDGQRAMEHLRAQCRFGARVPGSLAHENCAKYIGEQLATLKLTPQVQTFQAAPSLMKGARVTMRNIIARQGTQPRALVLSAHWDSRPVADQDPNQVLAGQPVMGANDAASGVAVVLELARIFSEQPPNFAIYYVLFDGEDLGSPQARNEWCLGSKRFVSALDAKSGIRAAINVDMVGDTSLLFTHELYATEICPSFESLCWSTGQALYPDQFTETDRRKVLDDHIPFLRAGIPAFDLIDLRYPYWHTTEDTTDKCSPRSLEIAGRTVEAVVRKMETMSWNFAVGQMPAELNGL